MLILNMSDADVGDGFSVSVRTTMEVAGAGLAQALEEALPSRPSVYLGAYMYDHWGKVIYWGPPNASFREIPPRASIFTTPCWKVLQVHSYVRGRPVNGQIMDYGWEENISFCCESYICMEHYIRLFQDRCRRIMFERVQYCCEWWYWHPDRGWWVDDHI